MSDQNIVQDGLLRQFALIIFPDIPLYVDENREAYEQWLKKEEAENFKKQGG